MPDGDTGVRQRYGLDHGADVPDPREWVIHGLLLEWADRDVNRNERRAQAILERTFGSSGAPRGAALAGNTASRAAMRLRRWLAAGGLALAATIAVVAGILFRDAVPARAGEPEIRAAAMQCVSLPLGVDPFLSENPAEYQRRLDEIQQYLRQRDDLLRQARGATAGNTRARAVNDALEAWAQAYRRLRDIGRFGEARSEIEKAAAFGDSPEFAEVLEMWRYIISADLGRLNLALGDYPAARRAFETSIRQRLAARDVVGEPGRDELASLGLRAFTVAPMYWALGTVCEVEGKLGEAREWQSKADLLWADYYRVVCRRNGISISDSADAITAYEAAPPTFRIPPAFYATEEEMAAQRAAFHGCLPVPTIVAHTRAHLYFEARLLRCEGRLSLARSALKRAAAMPDYAGHDEYRLPFVESLEQARIAILTRDYAEALRHVAEAECHAGALTIVDKQGQAIQKPPVASAVLAELTLLKGLALLAQDEHSAQGRQLIQRALRVPDALAAGLSPQAAAAFRKQFAAWRNAI